MMAGLFALLGVCILLAMGGWHRTAIGVFCINLILSGLMFYHHMNTALPVNF